MIKKRFLSMLVLLCLTVSGAWAQEVTLLTTIENTADGNVGFISGSKTFDNIATVTFSGYVNNDGDHWGWYADEECTLTVTAAEGYTITRVKFYTDKGSAFDEEAPFEAILLYDDESGYITKVNGTSIDPRGVTKIEVYGYETPAAPAAPEATVSADFEDGNMPAGWDASHANNKWYVDTEDYYGYAPAYSGTYSLYVDGNGAYDSDYFVSPALVFDGSAASLSFAYATPAWEGDHNDLSVCYGTSPNGPWNYTSFVWVNSSSWTTATVDLSSLNGTYYIAFESYDGYGYCTAIDNINITGAVPADAPTTYTVTLKEGTEDATNWTITPAEATTTGVAAGTEVKATYSGTKKVKSVKAKKKAAAAPAVIDLSMLDCAGNERTDGQWTANCYMVHTAGDYKLPLVYGNAIKNGATNTAAYTGVTDNSNATATFPRHDGEAITAPWIKDNGITVASAELLWQDAQGLITAVDIDGDYLTLTVGKDATEQEGNALVAAKDASGNVVWSWHIWVTKQTFADLTTIATGSHDYQVTPVNLGWVGDVVSQGYCTYYQWGRKDAFIPGTGTNTTNHTVYDISGGTVENPITHSTADVGIDGNIKNPTTFYNVSNKPNSTTYYNLWDAQQTNTGNIVTATTKTVYDPCPAGFCVPTGNLYNYMGNGDNRSDGNWDGNNKGKTWTLDGANLYFPASGCRGHGDGSLYDVGSYGIYWSASANNSNNGPNLYFYSGYWFWDNSNRAYGFPVRAVAEE